MNYQTMKTWRNFISILVSERNQSEMATYCMIPIIWHSGKGKTMDTVKRSVVARRCRERGWIGRTWRRFGAVKLFCVMLQCRIHVIVHLSRFEHREHQECRTPRVNFNVNTGLWVIMLCHCRLISYILLWWGCQWGEVVLLGRQGICENPLYSLLNFAVNLKLLFKNLLKQNFSLLLYSY